MRCVHEKPQLELVLEGPEINPATADPLTTLDLARSYFDLLVNIAREHGTALELRGLKISRGSMVVASRPDHPDVAVQVMTDASRYIGGALPPPPRLERRVEELRAKVTNLPLNVVATTRCGGTVRPLTPRVEEPLLPPREFVELRARLMGVGGQQPSARFASRSEDRPFSLRTDLNTAKKLGKLLYADVDLTAEVQRDEKGFIHSGVVHEFQAVDTDGDEFMVWREWFRKAGGDWNDIEDVEQELNRV